ncbi:MAG: GDP-mannose 4,6-dehydratase [Chloroflexota bacterium]|nr:GDP-mannose 4,6-dehydratase [Chloroflexota bacterium]
MGPRRVLVTGGCGFVGSHLVDALVAAGDTVTILDDLSTGKAENVKTPLDTARARFVHGSVLDTSLVDRLVDEADAVYHLAAAVGVSHIVRDPIRSALTNVQGTENVLAAAFRRRVPTLLTSSSEVYGKSTAAPFREDGERVLGPTWIHRWSYSTAKAMDEHLAFAYADEGLPVVVVRYFNAYGPRLDERGYGSVVARFIGQAFAGEPITVHGRGSQTRCFTYVDDTVRGTVLALNTPEARGKAFNIGADTEISIADLAVLVKDVAGSSSEIRNVTYESYYGKGFEDTPRRVPDTRRAREVLGFTAETPLREGLRSTVEWCRANYVRKDVAAG